MALAELAEQFDVHPNQIHDWKKNLLSHAKQIFQNGSRAAKDARAELKWLHAKIGQLTVEWDFLSAKLGR